MTNHHTTSMNNSRSAADRPISWALALPGFLTQREGGTSAGRERAYELLQFMAQDADAGRVAQVARTQLAATLRDLVGAVERSPLHSTEEIDELLAEARRLLALEKP